MKLRAESCLIKFTIQKKKKCLLNISSFRPKFELRMMHQIIIRINFNVEITFGRHIKWNEANSKIE